MQANKLSRIVRIRTKLNKIRTRTRESGGILPYVLNSYAIEKLKICAFRCNDEFYKIACKIHVVPFEYQDPRIFTMLPKRGRYVHYIVLFFWLVSILIRFEGLFLQMLSGKGALAIETFICATSVCVFVVCFCLSIPGLWIPETTIDLFNFIEKTERAIGFPLGHRVSYRKFLPAALKVISVTLALIVVASDNSLLSLVMTELPVFTYPMLKRLGIIPQGLLSDFTWALLIWPLDFAINIIPLLAAAFSANLMITSSGTYSVCILAIRALPRKTLKDHHRIHRLYSSLQIYNRVFADWIRVFLPFGLSSLSVAIVVVTYVAVRGDRLPGPIYIWFPVIAFFLMGIIFWLSYDGLVAKRASECIVGGLQSRNSEYLWAWDVERNKRKEILKRAKALRGASFPVGGFGELSYKLPINIWQGCLDQLLVLLTL